MSLPAGTRLGPYEILSPLGAGGMGEVYRAKDTRLDRAVAIKVLAAHAAASPEVRQRFEREARAISQLSHPYICALYDVGREGEADYLVMELLEGETLGTRLAGGPMALDQICRYGAEIADALGAAHSAGVVHRDLKPGNVMLTKSGVKLLDFGLAKALAPSDGPAARAVTSLPTEAKLTQEGTILGTFQYMAPEQLEGRPADARTDIFALGSTLYEMATGRPAFAGTTPMSVASAILRSEPRPMAEIAPMTPPALDRLVRRCLAKDPEERWQSARDVAAELRFLRSEVSSPGRAPLGARAPRVSLPRVLPWAVAAVALAGAAWLLTHRPASGPPGLVHLSFSTPPLVLGVHPVSPAVAVSPDGSRIAFIAAPGGKPQLYVRDLETTEPRALPGTEGAEGPFFSPDGRMLGFWTEDTLLKKVSVSGGTPELLCKGQTHIHGGSWCPDGTIMFSTQRKIWRVAASGGEPKEVAAPEGEARLYFPETLPGCRTVVYSVLDAGSAPIGIVGQSLETGKRVTLVKAGSNAHFAPPGTLLYIVNGTLMAAPFDPDGLSLTGPPVRVLDGVAYGAPQERALGQFSVSRTGTLAFVAGPSFSSGKGELLWVERDGTESVIKEVGVARGARLSPDGHRIVYQRRDESVPNSQPMVWVYDIERGTTSRVTFDGDSWWPVWTPDGRRVVFIHSTDQKNYALAWQNADGTGPLEAFAAAPGRVRQPQSWTPDGRLLLAHDFPWPSQSSGTSGFDIVAIPRDGDRTAVPLIATPFTESLPFVSPDGRWLAYVSDESGRSEVYVRPYPALDAKYQVSIDGGDEPAWSPAGGELFYRDGAKMMAVDVAAGPGFRAGKPHMLFQNETARGSRQGRDYDVSRDGRRFLMLKLSYAGTADRVDVVLGWPALLRSGHD